MNLVVFSPDLIFGNIVAERFPLLHNNIAAFDVTQEDFCVFLFFLGECREGLVQIVQRLIDKRL